VFDHGDECCLRTGLFAILVVDEALAGPDILGFFEAGTRRIRAHAGEQQRHVVYPALGGAATPLVNTVVGTRRLLGLLYKPVDRVGRHGKRKAAGAFHLFEPEPPAEQKPHLGVAGGNESEAGRGLQSFPCGRLRHRVHHQFGAVLFGGERLEVVGEGGADAPVAKLWMHLHIEPRQIALGDGAGFVDRPRDDAAIHPGRKQLLRLVLLVEPDWQQLGCRRRKLVGTVALGLGDVTHLDRGDEVSSDGVGGVRVFEVRRDGDPLDREIGHDGGPFAAVRGCGQPTRVPLGARRRRLLIPKR
jgi:hypothetical protein